jgi:hypothetical protein
MFDKILTLVTAVLVAFCLAVFAFHVLPQAVNLIVRTDFNISRDASAEFGLR